MLLHESPAIAGLKHPMACMILGTEEIGQGFG